MLYLSCKNNSCFIIATKMEVNGMVIRGDLIKVIFLMIILFLVIKYPEQSGKLLTVLLATVVEFLFNKIITDLQPV